MTTLQKIAMASAVTVAIGSAFYGSHVSNTWKDKYDEQSLSYAALQEATHGLKADAVSYQQEIARLKKDLQDIHRLRAEVTQSKMALQKLQRAQQAPFAMNTAASALLNRVALLDHQFVRSPDALVPEMVLLTEDDWLQAARGKLDTEGDIRRAMSELRGFAEDKVVDQLTAGIRRFKEETGQDFPDSIKDLMPFLNGVLTEDMLARWSVVPKASLMAQEFAIADKLITQQAPVDDVFDQWRVIGPNSGGVMDYALLVTRDILRPVSTAYKEFHNGARAESAMALLPYVETDEQLQALEKLMMREKTLGEDYLISF